VKDDLQLTNRGLEDITARKLMLQKKHLH